MTAVETPAAGPAPAPASPSARRNAYWRLFGVELRRFAARAAVRWLVLGMLAVVAVTAFAAYRATVPPSQAQLDRAQTAYEEQLAYWEENGEQQLATCREQEAAERERNPDEQIDFGCEQMTAPQLEWFLPGRTTFADSASAWLFQEATLLLMLALVVGATFVAAEFSTGSISTWLTFEPRRGRVFASKTTVVTVATGLAVLVVGAVAVGASWAAASVNDAVGDVTPELWRTLAGEVARTGAAGAVAALLGSGLAFLLRHTAAAVAIVVGWFVAVEGILTSLVPALLRWTVRITLTGWLQDGTQYYATTCHVDPTTGYVCESVTHQLSMWNGGAVLLAYGAVVTVAALVVFRRRDVA